MPLLASFFATNKQGELSLRLLMPYATGGDLQTWMMSESVPLYPPFLGDQTSLTNFIYNSILDLISALAYVHAERNGMWTGHYDIKPANILLFGEEGKWVWKLSDFGHSYLKSVGSEPGTDRHIGTLDYEPPEYWTACKREEALSFDVYAMGCVIIQLATFIVYPDWEKNQVRAFHHQRTEPGGDPGQSKNHPFGTNKPVVDRWIGQLRRVHGKRKLGRLLDTAEVMIKEDPKQRLLAFDAAIDIWAQCNQGNTSVGFETQCERLTKGQGPRPKFRESYNPHEREKVFAALYGNDLTKIRERCLTEVGWRKPPTNRLNISRSVSSRTMNSFTTLPATYSASNLCGRDHQLDLVDLHFEDAYTVGIFGIGGIGKSHVASRYAADLRKKASNSGNSLHTFWVQAKTMSTLQMSYTAIGREVGIADEDGQVSLESVKGWLQHPDNGPWLMVLDGLDEDYEDLSTYCPWNTQKVLITTKNREVALQYCEPDRVIMLDGLDAEDNLALFKQRVPTISLNDEQPAKSLASRLHLPLYIELMSAYINLYAGEVSIASMDHRLRSKRNLAAHTAKREKRRPGFGDMMPKDFTFFEIVFEPLKKQYKHCEGVLRLMCLFSKDSIDKKVIRKRCKSGEEAEILGCLTNLCFIKEASRDHYSMHEIVQTMFLESIIEKQGVESLWSGRLLSLAILREEYSNVKSRQSAENFTGVRTHRHLLALRYRVHVEEFLEFIRDRPDVKGQFFLPSARAVVGFAGMFRDENCFEDAIVLLNQLKNRGIRNLTIGPMEPASFKEAAQKLRFRAVNELIETHRARASGRHNFKDLHTALKLADGIIEEATVANNLYMKRRLCETRIDVLRDMHSYEKARRLIDELDAEEIAESTNEAEFKKLRILDLKASVYCCEGKENGDIEQLQKSQNLWQELLNMIPKSPHDEQVKKEKEREAHQGLVTTCLHILTVLTENPFAANLDVQAIGNEAFDIARDLTTHLHQETERIYSEEAPRLSQHRHIQDAKLQQGALMLRYGLWRRGDNQFHQILECVKRFREVLSAYRTKLGLPVTDKDVRGCAYYLRESLHWLETHKECSIEFVSMREKLEQEYDMVPWKD